MKQAKITVAALAAMLASGALAEDYVDDWGPALGDKAPAIEAQDQSGTVRDFASLAGERGLALFMTRSADW